MPIRGWRYAGGGRLAPRALPDPSLAGDEVLVEVEAAVVGEPELAGAAEPDPARTPGGAAVGRVIAAAEASGAVGARVLVGPHLPCGECELCKRGHVALCEEGAFLGRTTDGTLASHVVSRARWLCRLEGELDVAGPEAALLAREAAEAYAMYARGGVAPGEAVLIIGGGPHAKFLEAIGRARGTRPVVARAGEAAAEVQSRLGEPPRPLKIFEASRTGAGRALANEVAPPGSTVTLLAGGAAPGGEGAFDPARLAAREVTIVGVAGAHPDFLPEVVALAVRREIDPAAAAEIIPSADAEHALARATDAHEQGKVGLLVF